MKANWVLLVVLMAACGGKGAGEGTDVGAVDLAVPESLEQICEPGTRWCEENDAMACTAEGLSAWRTPCGSDICFEGTCCTRMCFDRSCGDDGCGGTCGDCGPYLACDEETWECGPPCAEELFSAEVCGSGEDVQTSCGACTSDGAGALCLWEEEDAQGVVQTWCECWGEEEGFHCTWKRPIPGQTGCQTDDDCPGGLCAASCEPHVPPYCTSHCEAHADCPEGSYCGARVSVDFWIEPDSYGWDHSARCVPDGFIDCRVPCENGWFADGCPCENDADCQVEWTDGYCIPSRHGRMCTLTHCMPECERNLTCAGIVNTGPDIMFQCVDPYIIEGMPCRSDDECRFPWNPQTSSPVGSCVVMGNDGAFCVAKAPNYRQSFSPATCLSGGACALMTPGPIPEDFLECPWYHVEVEAATDCALSNEHGTCMGERRCTEAGLTDCDAPIPAEELCDTVDNDCDGETDEGC
jgi:hypothetical protein